MYLRSLRSFGSQNSTFVISICNRLRLDIKHEPVKHEPVKIKADEQTVESRQVA